MHDKKKKAKGIQLNKATSAIVTKKRKLFSGGLMGQNSQQGPQLSEQDQASEQQADALIGGIQQIPVAGQVIGGFMKIGQGIGKQTVDQDGIYKGSGVEKQANSFIDNNFNPTTGIQNFKDFSKNINAKTALSQFSGGLLGKSATQIRREKEKAGRLNSQQAANNFNMMQNFGNTFAEGGQLPTKQRVLQGGSLNKISKDAVEVNATNPNQTDSVELDSAYVDHNEIIDNKDRVFSDELLYTNGKSIAKEAKRLEKMKNSAGRFKQSNDFIDSKLDNLFNYQEAKKRSDFAASKGPIKGEFEDPYANVLQDAQKQEQTQNELQRVFSPKKKLTTQAERYKDFKKSKGLAFGGELDPTPKTKSTQRVVPGAASPYYLDPTSRQNAEKLGAIKDYGEITREQYLESQSNPDKFPADHPLMSSYGTYQSMRKEFQANPNLRSMHVGELYDTKIPGQPFGASDVGPNIYQRTYEDPIPTVNDVSSGPMLAPQTTPMNVTQAPKRQVFSGQGLPDSIKRKTQGYQYNRGKPAKGSITKPKRALGGFAFNADDYASQDNRTWEDQVALGGYNPQMETQQNTPKKGNNINWQNIGTTAATFAPNIANAFLQRKLKGPASPELETAINLQRIDPSAQLADAQRSANLAQQSINRGVSQSSDLISATGSILSRRLANQNQIYGNVNAQNAQINNQEVGMNQAMRARNIERTNDFRQAGRDFSNKKLQMTSENIANASEKIQAKGREKNMIDKDLLSEELINKRYEDSGVIDRNTKKILDEYRKKKGLKAAKKLGGKLNNKLMC